MRPALAILLTAAAVGCGPRLNVPPRPLRIPGALGPDDSGAVMARELAPVLYLQADESFPLLRVVAVVHPGRRVIAYHLLWKDDAHGAWVPYTMATDQEVVWVGVDSAGAPIHLWTYWHGSILHTEWPKVQVLVDVQWGKHGSLPRGVHEEGLPAFQSLSEFWLLSWLGLPDLWLGRLSRPGPLCFCGGPGRYRRFDRALPLAPRLDAIIRAQDPDPALRAAFGDRYSRKPPWPWTEDKE